MANRTECEAVVRRLWPYLDGVVLEADREAIVRHLETCAGCKSAFDFARVFLEAVATAKPHLADNNRLRRRVLGALAGAGFTGDPSEMQ
jgi:hypothetical protein